MSPDCGDRWAFTGREGGSGSVRVWRGHLKKKKDAFLRLQPAAITELIASPDLFSCFLNTCLTDAFH